MKQHRLLYPFCLKQPLLSLRRVQMATAGERIKRELMPRAKDELAERKIPRKWACSAPPKIESSGEHVKQGTQLATKPHEAKMESSGEHVKNDTQLATKPHEEHDVQLSWDMNKKPYMFPDHKKEKKKRKKERKKSKEGEEKNKRRRRKQKMRRQHKRPAWTTRVQACRQSRQCAAAWDVSCTVWLEARPLSRLRRRLRHQDASILASKARPSHAAQ